MGVTIKNIIPRKLAESSQTEQYASTGCKTVIDVFTVTNVSGGDVLFSCNLPANGEAAGDSNLVLKARGIAPNETYECPELVGQVLESGGTISTLAGAAGALVISASGRQIT